MAQQKNKPRFVRRDEQTQTRRRTNERTQPRVGEGIPEDWVPLDETGLHAPSNEADVFDIRMNNRQAIHDIWKTLAGMTYKTHEGKTYLVPIRGVDRKVTFQGVMKVINKLQFLTNPAIALGNTSYEESKTLALHNWESIGQLLVDDKKNFRLSYSEREAFMSSIESYIWTQLSRSIDGFEAKNLVTQITEERGEHQVTQKTGGSQGFWGAIRNDN